MPLATKLLWGSFAFFVVATAFFVFVLLGGGNIISTSNVDISFDAPSSVEAGRELTMRVRIVNNNDADLENARLRITFPEGTRRSDDPEQAYERTERTIGTVASGDAVTETFSVLLFGQKGDTRDIAATLEYRTEGSNATFVDEADYSVTINAAPFSLELSAPDEVSSGQAFPTEITLTSNADEPISNVLVQAAYPFGFSYTSASREPAFQNDTWRIARLASEETWRVTVNGSLEGQDKEEKTIRAHVGTARADNPRAVGIAYSTARSTIQIVRPFLGLELILNDSSEDEVSVVNGGEIRGELTWRNNTPARLSDITLSAELTGNALDKGAVSARDGFWQSAQNVITWDKTTTDALSEAAPGASGRLDFTFTPRVDANTSALHNTSGVRLHLTGTAERSAGAGSGERVEHTFSRAVKITTDAGISQRVLHTTGAFTNTGPIPPRAEQETTYTVVWSLVNSLNDIAGTDIEAELPPYVAWTGQTSSDGAITFDEDTRTVRWDAGAVAAGTGITRSAREASFRITFQPSATQIGRAPVLVERALLSAQDTYTGDNVSASTGPVTTRITADPQYQSGDGVVVE